MTFLRDFFLYSFLYSHTLGVTTLISISIFHLIYNSLGHVEIFLSDEMWWLCEYLERLISRPLPSAPAPALGADDAMVHFGRNALISWFSFTAVLRICWSLSLRFAC
jgi:hypothetical protein